MSLNGTKRTLCNVRSESAFRGKAEVRFTSHPVSFWVISSDPAQREAPPALRHADDVRQIPSRITRPKSSCRRFLAHPPDLAFHASRLKLSSIDGIESAWRAGHRGQDVSHFKTFHN
jgi:hypothetical protein